MEDGCDWNHHIWDRNRNSDSCVGFQPDSHLYGKGEKTPDRRKDERKILIPKYEREIL